MMRARELMTRDPKAVTRGARVAEAVAVMRDRECGCVPVIDAEESRRVVGMLTDRDVALGACTEQGEGPDTRISSIVSENLFTVSVDDDLRRIEEVMRKAGVRRVPVVEEGDRLVGIVSLHDLAERCAPDQIGELAESILDQRPNN